MSLSIDVTSKFTLVSVPYSSLKEEYKEYYDNDEDKVIASLDEVDLSDVDIANEVSFVEFDEEGFFDYLENLLNYDNYSGYVAYWPGRDAYSVTREIDSLFDPEEYDYVFFSDYVSDDIIRLSAQGPGIQGPEEEELLIAGVHDPDDDVFEFLISKAGLEEIKEFFSLTQREAKEIYEAYHKFQKIEDPIMLNVHEAVLEEFDLLDSGTIGLFELEEATERTIQMLDKQFVYHDDIGPAGSFAVSREDYNDITEAIGDIVLRVLGAARKRSKRFGMKNRQVTADWEQFT